MPALRETPLEIKVIFELGDATHSEVTLDEEDARNLLAFLQRRGFVSNDSTVGQVASALEYVLEPEEPPLLYERHFARPHAGPIPPVNDECPDNDTGDE